jgi:ketosteroid isomerase-like protein
MSQKNVELVQRSSTFYSRGEEAAAIELLHPDVEWVVAREHPNARTLMGRAALLEYQREWQQTLPGLNMTLDRVLDAGDSVLAIGAVRGTGLGSGVDVEVPIALVYTFRDGLIARVEEYLDPGEAVQAVGLTG